VANTGRLMEMSERNMLVGYPLSVTGRFY